MQWLNTQINKLNEIFKKLKSMIYESIRK
jgi:chaperonin cofactor prefoldin